MIATRKEWPNVIINTKTKQEHRSDIKGTLSIFSNLSGEARITADNTSKTLGEETYFISNEEQLYGIDIDNSVETFNIHFSTSMLQGLVPSIISKHEQLLDRCGTASTSFNFANQLYWKDEYFRRTIQVLKEKSDHNELDDLATEEILASLLEHLFLQQAKVSRNVEALAVSKYTTRTEIVKRLGIAIDYMHAQYSYSLSLEELAQVSCMSKFHFLRTFKQVYGATPYQYIMRIRLDRAKQLLQETTMPISDIAAIVGYEDLSVFSRSFKRRYSYQPVACRNRA